MTFSTLTFVFLFVCNRKQCANHVSLKTRQLQTYEEKTHRHRHRSAKLQTTPLHCLANFMDPAHFYVDLASLQNTTHLPNSHCQYGKLMNAVMCVSNNNKKSVPNNPNQPPYYYNNNNRKHQHVPMSNIYQQPLNNIENVMNKGSRKTVKAVENEPLPPAFKRNVKKFPQVSKKSSLRIPNATFFFRTLGSNPRQYNFFFVHFNQNKRGYSENFRFASGRNNNASGNRTSSNPRQSIFFFVHFKQK